MNHISITYESHMIFIALMMSASAFANSPYINKVYEYRPAPGQFINVMPKYEDGDTEESMRQKAEDAIANNAQSMICLGGWGGYVVFGFDHPIVNDKGNYDFIVLGNAFAGSAEPGVVCVSYDKNGNGEPDDEWFELAGSMYGNKSVYSDYEVTYSRPAPDHVATPDKDNKWLLDTTHVAWQDNQGAKGHIMMMNYHTQPHYPQWISEDKMVFTGTRLPNNGYYNETTKRYVRDAFAYGYADNQPNTDDAAKLKIDWAIKADGTPANLSMIHFVKVYTGTNQQDYYQGRTGETSTEIIGAEDLHPEMPMGVEGVESVQTKSAKIIRDGQIYIVRKDGIYSLYGTKIQ